MSDAGLPYDSTRQPLAPPRYHLIGYCLAIGVTGALAALAFDWLVEMASGLLLGGVGGFEPPASGSLHPDIALPPWSVRWRLPLATTLGGLLSGFLVYRFAPEAEGHGTDAAVAAYHQRGGRVRRRVAAIKALASAVTIGSGGVAGREGPAAQVSVGISALLADVLRLRGQERRILLLAGMAAGLAAIFHSPLGMAIFSVEILYSEMVFEGEALIYTVISAVTAYALHGWFTGWEPLFAIPSGLAFADPPTLIGYAVLGVVAGAVGAALPWIFYRTRALFRRLPGPPHWKPALGGLLVGLVAMAEPRVLGAGYGWMELALAGSLGFGTVLAILVLKGPLMSLTIGSGGSGGVFGPTVVIGALLGSVVGALFARFAPFLHSEPAAFVLVGMAAVFAGAARTPISTLIMVAEMTGGYGLIVPTMLANMSAFLVQRSLTSGSAHPTLYEAQVPSREDSPAHRGVLVRRAIELIEGGALHRSELSLPRLVDLLRYGEPIPLSEHGGALLALVVESGSVLDGSTIQSSLGQVEGVTAVAVVHDDEMLVPRGPTPLVAGDRVIAMATAAAQRELAELAAAPESAG